MNILETKNLTYTYSQGTPFAHDAITDVSVAVREGEFLGIIGHTGSGKSTLVQHLNGLFLSLIHIYRLESLQDLVNQSFRHSV